MIWLLQHYWPLFAVCAVLGFFLTLASMIRTVKVTRVESATVSPAHTATTTDTKVRKARQDKPDTAVAPVPVSTNSRPTPEKTSTQHPDDDHHANSATQHLPNLPIQNGPIQHGRTGESAPHQVTDLRPFDTDRPAPRKHVPGSTPRTSPDSPN